MKKIFISSLFSLAVFLAFSQQEIPFTKNMHFYLKGGSTIIGNNIVSKYSNKPYNNPSIINDKIKMVYVDIDNDKSTFSSSQASLKLPKETKRVVYAALYWSAIYSYDKGTKKIRGDRYIYEGNDQRDENFNTIKIKLPNKDYLTITGDILFDGYNLTKYKENAPYACSADITDLFSESKSVNGNYTVANIKATQGYISGGAAAGWFIYIVYENENEKLKSITTYDGFSQLNKKPEIITLKGFRTIKEGPVKANISIAALEGDISIKTDECLFKNIDNGKFVNLTTAQRPKKNFFNSTISIGSNTSNRHPYSKNTLGFDLLQLDIPNENNSIINNSAEETYLHLKTKTDRFFLYFTAFETEIDTNYIKEKKVVKDTPVNIDQNEGFVKQEEDKEATNDSDLIDAPTNNQKPIQIRTLKNIDIEKKYYLVTNVFSKPNLAKNWKQFLIDNGHTPKSFINSENNWEYVYVHSSKNLSEVETEFNQLKTRSYFKEIWICKID